MHRRSDTELVRREVLVQPDRQQRSDQQNNRNIAAFGHISRFCLFAVLISSVPQ